MKNVDLASLQTDILNTYYADNAKKLHKMVDSILCKFGGLSGKDTDDFYSLANEVFVDVMKRYDHKQSFDGFLYSCLLNKIKTEMTRRNREKRKSDRMCVSLDVANDDEEKCSLLDFMASDFDAFEEAIKRQGSREYQDKIQRYISKLSNRQINILNFLMDGYKPAEIQQIFCISSMEYSDDLRIMRSYENIKILF